MARMPVALALAACVLASVATRSALAAPGLPTDWQRGANVTAWSADAFARPMSDDSLARLRDTGTTNAAIVVTWYMDTATSSSVAPRDGKTPSDASLVHAIERAKALGMNVTLKPHVDVWDGTFRGEIAPASRADWYASYRAMIDHYADLAAQAGADALVVGTELTSMTSDDAQWRAIIAEVRARFGGRLTFAANWIAGAQRIAFWRDLDYIGVDGYMPLASENPNPPVADLVSAWHRRGYVDQLAGLQRQYDRPVVFTELGYQSRLGTAITPWWTDTGDTSQEAQQNAYEAAFEVWSQVPWLKGIYWWDWSADGYNQFVDDNLFHFAGKLAEATVRSWNTGPPPAPAPTDSGLPAVAPANPAGRRAPVRARLLYLYVPGGARMRVRFARSRSLAPSCVPRVTLRLSRWSHARSRWSHVRSIRAGERGRGRYAVALPALRPGRYRARGALAGAGCRPARSTRTAFTVARRG